MADSTPSNMQDFTENSYNLTSKGQKSCVKPGSLYTNPSANFNYFNSKCGDSYTYYGYWYRRFPNQSSYLNCYYYPYKDIELKNKYGYLQSNSSCLNTITGVRYNKLSNGNSGFPFYDTQINPSTARFSLKV